MDLSWFSGNKSFHAICLAHLMDAAGKGAIISSAILRQVFIMIQNDLKNGNIRPLNTVVYDRSKCEDAFRFMASGKHVGKILIQMMDPEEAHLYTRINANQRLHFDAEKSYIVIGGLGGFGSLFMFMDS